MSLPRASAKYDQASENQARDEINRELARRPRKGDTLYFDRNELVLRSPDGSRWALKVDDLGAVSAELRA